MVTYIYIADQTDLGKISPREPVRHCLSTCKHNRETSSFMSVGKMFQILDELEVVFVTGVFSIRNTLYTLVILNPLSNHQYQKIPRSEDPMYTHFVQGGGTN